MWDTKQNFLFAMTSFDKMLIYRRFTTPNVYNHFVAKRNGTWIFSSNFPHNHYSNKSTEERVSSCNDLKEMFLIFSKYQSDRGRMGHPLDGCIKHWSVSVRPWRPVGPSVCHLPLYRPVQIPIFLSLSVRCSYIAEGRRLCWSSGPHTL